MLSARAKYRKGLDIEIKSRRQVSTVMSVLASVMKVIDSATRQRQLYLERRGVEGVVFYVRDRSGAAARGGAMHLLVRGSSGNGLFIKGRGGH